MVRRGRAIAQAVSRWLPTAAYRVRVRAEYCGVLLVAEVPSGPNWTPPPTIPI
jgi:hypothetical protein